MLSEISLRSVDGLDSAVGSSVDGSDSAVGRSVVTVTRVLNCSFVCH